MRLLWLVSCRHPVSKMIEVTRRTSEWILWRLKQAMGGRDACRLLQSLVKMDGALVCTCLAGVVSKAIKFGTSRQFCEKGCEGH